MDQGFQQTQAASGIHTSVDVAHGVSPGIYWLDITLFEITGAISTPLIIDASTHNRMFGHYTHVLVDIDISHRLFHEIIVERE